MTKAQRRILRKLRRHRPLEHVDPQYRELFSNYVRTRMECHFNHNTYSLMAGPPCACWRRSWDTKALYLWVHYRQRGIVVVGVLPGSPRRQPQDGAWAPRPGVLRRSRGR